MGRKSRLDRAVVVLLRNTTWRCGKFEELIIKHLRSEQAYGIGTPIIELVRKFRSVVKEKREVIEAVKRLHKRKIVEIRNES